MSICRSISGKEGSRRGAELAEVDCIPGFEISDSCVGGPGDDSGINPQMMQISQMRFLSASPAPLREPSSNSSWILESGNLANFRIESGQKMTLPAPTPLDFMGLLPQNHGEVCRARMPCARVFGHVAELRSDVD